MSAECLLPSVSAVKTIPAHQGHSYFERSSIACTRFNSTVTPFSLLKSEYNHVYANGSVVK